MDQWVYAPLVNAMCAGRSCGYCWIASGRSPLGVVRGYMHPTSRGSGSHPLTRVADSMEWESI